MRPRISARPFGNGIIVYVMGRFGGGYEALVSTPERAAAMILRDAPKYDCGSGPISVAVCPEVRAILYGLLLPQG